MQYLVYISAAAKLFTDAELKALLIKCRDNNKRNNITGVLLYSEGTFLQVLEGEEGIVSSTFSKIGGDPRHTGIIKLVEENQDERVFPEWSMAFKTVSAADFAELKAFIQPGNLKLPGGDDHPSVMMIRTFFESNKM